LNPILWNVPKLYLFKGYFHNTQINMIPKLHYISQGSSHKSHLDNIQNACANGAELIVMDIQNSSEKKFLKTAKQARDITVHFQTRLIINAHIKLAKDLKVDGIHIDTTSDCPNSLRKNLYPWQLIGATANSFQDCENFIKKEVDYIYLAPFRAVENTQSTVLGLNGFTVILEALQSDTPIIGVGGINTADVTSILETGISGIGVSDEITQDFNTIKIFSKLLTASSTEERRYTF